MVIAFFLQVCMISPPQTSPSPLNGTSISLDQSPERYVCQHARVSLAQTLTLLLRTYCETDIDPSHRKYSQLQAAIRYLQGKEPDLECTISSSSVSCSHFFSIFKNTLNVCILLPR